MPTSLACEELHMNHEKFADKGDGFEVHGLRVELNWKTANSISFELCHHRSSKVRQVFGWLDVHETNEKYRRVKMRLCLEHNYLKLEEHVSFIETVLDQLALSHDSYEATFISPLKHMIHQTSDAMEFISYGLPGPPGDNYWDDREGISPLEVIPREKGFGMLLEAFPEFHRHLDGIERNYLAEVFGAQFLGTREMFALIGALESAFLEGDHHHPQRVFDVLEKLAIYGDQYTRHASLPRLFEMLLQRGDLAQKLKPLMLEKTLAAFNETVIHRK